MTRFYIPDEILNIVKRLSQEGGASFLVGGCVRDLIRGVVPKDFDIEVYYIPVERLKEVLLTLGDVNTVGESFTVFKMGPHIDISIPRRDKKISRGHRGFEVTGDPYMSVEEASSRRDFTINAIMYDPLKDELVDPQEGVKDLSNKLLRVVSKEHFTEDSLRVLRGAQFASRFQFELEAESFNFCKAVPLNDLAVERIWGELEKLFLLSDKPSLGWSLLYEMDVVKKLFSGLENLTHPQRQRSFHLMNLLSVRNRDLTKPKFITLLLASLFASEEIVWEEDNWITVSSIGAKLKHTKLTWCDEVMDKMGVHSIDGFSVRENVKKILIFKDFFKNSIDSSHKSFLPKIKRMANFVECELLIRFVDSYNETNFEAGKSYDASKKTLEDFKKFVNAHGLERSGPIPVFAGKDLIKLGVKPSKQMGDLLERLYEMQLDGVFSTKKDGLVHAQQWIEKNKINE